MGRRSLRKRDASLDLSWHLVKSEALGLMSARESVFKETGLAEYAPTHLLKFVSGQPASIEIEVGSGKGLFLEHAASSNPDKWYAGIELAVKYAEHTAARLAKRELRNAIVIQGDAKQVFSETLTSASVDAVHVYFPDPWWKKKHRRRRVLSADFLKDIQRVLRVGGRLHFWTDVHEYFESTLERIRELSGLHGPIDVPESAPRSDLDYRTHFERRVRKNNQPVYRAEFERIRTAEEEKSIELLKSVHDFPTRMIIKAIGGNVPGFSERILRTIAHELNSDQLMLPSIRETPGGRHIAVSIEPIFQRPEEVLAVYGRLRLLPDVVMLL
jgi:tRNA (guanine-N7-)-methyltransferase